MIYSILFDVYNPLFTVKWSKILAINLSLFGIEFTQKENEVLDRCAARWQLLQRGTKLVKWLL